jgi:hypothetical protein
VKTVHTDFEVCPVGTQELVDQVADLIHSAYREGFCDGVDHGDPNHLNSKPHWEKSHARRFLVEMKLIAQGAAC